MRWWCGGVRLVNGKGREIHKKNSLQKRTNQTVVRPVLGRSRTLYPTLSVVRNELLRRIATLVRTIESGANRALARSYVVEDIFHLSATEGLAIGRGASLRMEHQKQRRSRALRILN